MLYSREASIFASFSDIIPIICFSRQSLSSDQTSTLHHIQRLHLLSLHNDTNLPEFMDWRTKNAVSAVSNEVSMRSNIGALLHCLHRNSATLH